MYRLLAFLTLVFTATSVGASVDAHFQTLQNHPAALYAFLHDMPKGGELHYHYDGAVYAETMLHLATRSKICIHPTSLSAQGCHIEPKTLSIRDIVHSPSMFTKILHSWSMQSFVPHHESAHDHFFAVFPKVGVLYSSLKAQLLAAILRKAAAQHELYMEIIAFGLADDDRYAKLIREEADLSKKRALLLADPAFQRSVQQIVDASQSFLPAAHEVLHCAPHPHEPACNIQVKYQTYVRRVKSPDSVFAQALAGFVAAERSAHIVGINLLDIEDDATAQQDYAQHMQIFQFLHTHYPKVHIALHAGELYPMKVAPHIVRSPIRDAIVIGHAERIGHGLDIADEPDASALADMMAQKSIAVEVNLTSNHMIFGVQGSQHPLRFYLQHKVPVVLSTDDEGILRTDLTKEYVKAAQEHHLDYATLKQINRNTLTYAFLPGTSIWADPYHAIRVKACQELTSHACQVFIKNNPKAHLQWQLEQALAVFESKFASQSTKKQ